MLPALRSASAKVVQNAALPAASRKFVHASTVVPAIEKLRCVLNDYNEHNFRQGLPSNFVAHLLEQTDENEKTGCLSAKAAQRALYSLSLHDTPGQHVLSSDDASHILKMQFNVKDEDTDQIPTEQWWRLFFDNVDKTNKKKMTAEWMDIARG